MDKIDSTGRAALLGAALTAAAALALQSVFSQSSGDSTTFSKTATPDWLLAFWKEIDDKIFDDPSKGVLRPAMTHFFYRDEADPTRARAWYGSVGPIEFWSVESCSGAIS